MSIGAWASGGVALAAKAPELRVLVEWRQPSPQGTDTDQSVLQQAIVKQAMAASRVPVRYVSASGGAWHALALQCKGTAQCDQALAGLKAEGSGFAAAEIDQRRRALPAEGRASESRPSPAASR